MFLLEKVVGQEKGTGCGLSCLSWASDPDQEKAAEDRDTGR